MTRRPPARLAGARRESSQWPGRHQTCFYDEWLRPDTGQPSIW